MKHKVICSDCGKVERIEVVVGKKVSEPWKYFGKININFNKTTKYLHELIGKDGVFDINKTIKVYNPYYDVNEKPKYVEDWECGCREK